MSETHTFRVDPNVFSKGVANAKKFGGVFDADSKTWTITLNRFKTPGNLVEQPYLYGLQLVSPAAPAAPAARHGSECPALMGGACECDGF